MKRTAAEFVITLPDNSLAKFIPGKDFALTVGINKTK